MKKIDARDAVQRPLIEAALKKRKSADLLHNEKAVKMGEEIASAQDPFAKILEMTHRLDHWEASVSGIELDRKFWEKIADKTPAKARAAIANAAGRIRAFHEKQKAQLDAAGWEYREPNSGITLGQSVRPLHRVGVYIPGGRAAYPSTVLMNVIPARVAGVREIIMVSPTPAGEINPIIVAAALEAGVDRIFRLGGAQAVYALAYGYGPVPKVDKIVGPGNAYVQSAKKAVFGEVNIDMVAGPSEILIIADSGAQPAWLAADLLSQAEHDPLAASILISPDERILDQTMVEIESQLPQLSTEKTAQKSMHDFGLAILTHSLEQAAEIANQIAPEHLELCVAQPEALAPAIVNAGALFMGYYTPEPVGDYLAGPNHVLPTNGSARFFSPLGVYDFLKRTSLLSFGAEDLQAHAADIITLAEAEGFPAHAKAVKIRLAGK